MRFAAPLIGCRGAVIAGGALCCALPFLGQPLSVSAQQREESITVSYAGEVTNVALSPDGATLAIHASHRNQPDTLTLWDRASRSERKRLKAPEGLDLSLRFSNDGKKLRGWSW